MAESETTEDLDVELEEADDDKEDLQEQNENEDVEFPDIEVSFVQFFLNMIYSA